MTFRLAAAIVPLVTVAAAAVPALLVGCEFIASVDRADIQQPDGGLGASGGAGGSGGQGGAGTGASAPGGAGGTGGAPECVVAADCKGTDSTCQSRACTDGVCDVINAPLGFR